MPQALLLMAFLMNLLILVLNTQMMVLSPQYSTFGSQTFLDDQNNKHLCSLSQIHTDSNLKNTSNSCRISNLSSFTNRFGIFS